MGAVHVKTVNDRLLNVDYSDPELIKSLIKNWNMMERLAEKGDTVAPCILMDLERAIGVNLGEMAEDKYRGFKLSRGESVLTDPQFISIVYVLGLGYFQEEIAYVLGCTKKVVNVHISRGIKRIMVFLEGEEAIQEREESKKKRRRSSGQMVKGKRSLLYRKRKGKKRKVSVPHSRSRGKKKQKRDPFELLGGC